MIASASETVNQVGGVRDDTDDATTNHNATDHRHFRVESRREKYFSRFKTHGAEATIKITPPPENENPITWIEEAFKEIVELLTDGSGPNDYFGVTFGGDNFTKGPGGISMRPVEEFHFQDLWKAFSDVAQSTSGFDLHDSFVVNTHSVEVVNGNGYVGLTHENVHKQSVLSIANSDNLCLPRSLVCAYVHRERGLVTEGDWIKEWNQIRDSRRPYQFEQAIDLVSKSGLVIPDTGCGVPEILKLQEYYANYNIAIVVYDFKTFGRGGEPLFDGSSLITSRCEIVSMKLNIMYYAQTNHYQPILNMRGASGSRNYCVKCNKGYWGGHSCPNACFRCKGFHDSNDKQKVYCEKCNRWFFGRACFKNHSAAGTYNSSPSVCASLYVCKGCTRLIRRIAVHECDKKFCRVCKAHVDLNHFCYVQPVTGDQQREYLIRTTLYICYDFETSQSQLMKGTKDVNIHVPNLCVMQQSCATCIDIENIQIECSRCGIREKIFKIDPVKQFVTYVTSSFRSFKQVVCIAHNSSGFDCQFILRFAVEQMGMPPPEIILRGSKIIMMQLGKVKFIDSLNYFCMPLKAVPKAFGLDVNSELAKGMFPHLYTDTAHDGYLPPLQYYSPDTMMPKDRKECIKWYKEAVRNKTKFNFWDALVAYCRVDVDILRRGCLAFRKIFLEKGRVCPFAECVTIASTCMLLYRVNFLPLSTIGLIPTHGYRLCDNQSRVALEWLLWCEHKMGARIIHALRGREYKLKEGLTVDGYYETDTGVKHVFEFFGDYFHGCPRCKPVGRDESLTDEGDGAIDTLNVRYERTMGIADRIRRAGYILHTKWECDFKREKETSVELQDFLRDSAHLFTEPLNPRDAFYGGRTGNTVIQYDCAPNEKLKYVDVNSLYPFICKYSKMPAMHPEILLGDDISDVVGPNFDLANVEGLIACKILPPRDLYLPVLPVKMHQKLMFGLCRSCLESLEQEDCPHELEEERALSGTWVSDEVKEAVAMNYRILSISEIWQYNVVQYDRATRTGGIFAPYIDTWFKLKTLASGYPPECATDESKAVYLAQCNEREGIDMELDDVCENPSLRAVAKFCLNSLWGRIGMNPNKTKTTVIKTRQQLLKLLGTPTIEVKQIVPVNDDVLYAVWRYIDEEPETSSAVNVAIAAYVTCAARLELYKYLKALDQRVKYFDTDSIIYSSNDDDPSEYEPPTGAFLGDLTDELVKYGEGSYIESFLSGGPKFYAMRIRNAAGEVHEVCKVKGIRLTYENSLKINFDSIRALLRANLSEDSILNDNELEAGEGERGIHLKFRAIRRTKYHDVVTKTETKVCKPVCVKRRFINDRYSVPYGYKHL